MPATTATSSKKSPDESHKKKKKTSGPVQTSAVAKRHAAKNKKRVMTVGPKLQDIQRLGFRNGVVSMSKEGKQALVMLVMDTVSRVMHSASIPVRASKRKTMFTRDVQWAVNMQPDRIMLCGVDQAN